VLTKESAYALSFVALRKSEASVVVVCPGTLQIDDLQCVIDTVDDPVFIGETVGIASQKVPDQLLPSVRVFGDHFQQNALQLEFQLWGQLGDILLCGMGDAYLVHLDPERVINTDRPALGDVVFGFLYGLAESGLREQFERLDEAFILLTGDEDRVAAFGGDGEFFITSGRLLHEIKELGAGLGDGKVGGHGVPCVL